MGLADVSMAQFELKLSHCAIYGYGLWDMDYGYGIWIMDNPNSIIHIPLCIMDYGLWDMDYGLWDTDYGLWNMDYGSSIFHNQ